MPVNGSFASEAAAWARTKVKTVLTRCSSPRYRATRIAEELSCLRRHWHPGNAEEVRQTRLCKGKRFNSEIISSMIESLINGSSRRATRLEQ
jgi:hypothetical protein